MRLIAYLILTLNDRKDPLSIRTIRNDALKENQKGMAVPFRNVKVSIAPAKVERDPPDIEKQPGGLYKTSRGIGFFTHDFCKERSLFLRANAILIHNSLMTLCENKL